VPTGSLGLFWAVENAGKYAAEPVLQQPANDLDAHGALLDLVRLPEESNYSYYKRLQSVIPLRGGADQEGLVRAITRELGLGQKIGLKITPVSSGSGGLAPAPAVEVTATKVILYSSYVDSSSYSIDREIDIFDRGSGYLLEDLVSEILQSSYFVAELGAQMSGDERSSGLIPSSSTVWVPAERVPGSSFFFLEHTDVLEGTLFFTEKNVFSTEVSSTSAISEEGDYHVDYAAGRVTSHTSASGHGSCSYRYRAFPFRVQWSPISVYSLRNPDYRAKLFETESMPDGTRSEGLVTAEGSAVYSALFEECTSLWGV